MKNKQEFEMVIFTNSEDYEALLKPKIYTVYTVGMVINGKLKRNVASPYLNRDQAFEWAKKIAAKNGSTRSYFSAQDREGGWRLPQKEKVYF